MAFFADAALASVYTFPLPYSSNSLMDISIFWSLFVVRYIRRGDIVASIWQFSQGKNRLCILELTMTLAEGVGDSYLPVGHYEASPLLLFSNLHEF